MQNQSEAALRRRLLEDFPKYAHKCLKIRPKDGGIVGLELNESQLEFHRAIEEQKALAGKVRVLVLKARQIGFSTYVEGRFYHQVTHRFGVKAYVMAHRQEATDNLFTMTERFHENCPDPLRPVTGASNSKELSFQFLDSSFEISTAGAKGAGRSDTIQYLHGSEVAFWENAEHHADGLLQAVPDAPDTEVILESTANGPGGIFYNMCMAALEGRGDYLLWFVPWFKHHEYQSPADPGWQPPPKWREYGDMHGLSQAQLWWAFTKSEEMGIPTGDPMDEPCPKFRQEYPATVQEAFQNTSEDVLIKPAAVLRARKRDVRILADWPLVAGLDIARGGGDLSRIVSRQGRIAGRIDDSLNTRDLMEVVGWAQRWMADEELDWLFIDMTGLGAGVYDRMVELGHDNITGVNFGERAEHYDRYINKRAEIWARMNDWLNDKAGVSVPDLELVTQHLCAPLFSWDSADRLKLEPKEAIKKRLTFSPDWGDALALTFTHHVEPKVGHVVEALGGYETETYDDPEW